jgi:uncharacterized protein
MPVAALASVPNTVSRVARAVLHHALLRALRPHRLPHHPPVVDLPRGGGHLQPLTLTGHRGQRIAAWAVLPPAASPQHPVPAVLALHGWGANASTLWPLVEPLIEGGMAVLLLDASCHGASGDEAFSSLPRFAEDLASVRAELRRLPAIDPTRVALVGHSVGAGAVLLHAARAGGVAGVVSLSAFAHPQEVMHRWMTAMRLPRRWLGPTILTHVQSVIGERFDCIAPLASVPALDCPLLLVHGRHDTTVPADDARRLQAARPGAELLLVDGDHDLRTALAPHAARIVGFLATHLKAGSS